MEHILELKDGYIRDVQTDHTYISGGCDTCDMGSEYVVELDIYFSNSRVSFEVNNQYGFALSMSDVIKMFTRNVEKMKKMTEKECKNYITDYLKKSLQESGRDYFPSKGKKLLDVREG